MRALLLVSALIALAAASAPDLISRYALRTEGDPPEPASSADPIAAAATPSERGRVEIAAERDGHFYLEAEIDRAPVRFMVDTGASVVALRQSDAEAAGLRLRPGDFDQPVGTANGTTYAAAATLETVAVEGIEVSRVKALVLPDEQLSVSLLGASFLNRLDRFGVEDGVLVFEN